MKRIVAALLVAFAAQAHAGLFDDEQARQQVNDLRATMQDKLLKQDERLDRLEASSKSTLELLNQIDKLKEEVSGLRGKIEVLQFNIDEATKRQQDLYVDLDTRLRNMEQARVEQKTAQAAGEQKQLDDAIALVKSGKNKEGVAAIWRFTKDNPESPRFAEARYWSGVGFAALKDYKAANAAFGDVVNKAPDDARAPDALLGLASVAAAQKDNKASRKYLVTIVEKYPESAAAATAKKALTVAN